MTINNVLVVGASGKLGGLIVGALLKKNVQVTGLYALKASQKFNRLVISSTRCLCFMVKR